MIWLVSNFTSDISKEVSWYSCLKATGYTLLGFISVKTVIVPFRKGVYSKRKEFAPFGSKFFSFRVDPFQKRLVAQGSKQEVTKLKLSPLSGNLPSVSSPFKCWSRLTHLSVASHKRDIGKQCGPRSDATECGIWSGSTLFASRLEMSTKHNNNKN